MSLGFLGIEGSFLEACHGIKVISVTCCMHCMRFWAVIHTGGPKKSFCVDDDNYLKLLHAFQFSEKIYQNSDFRGEKNETYRMD